VTVTTDGASSGEGPGDGFTYVPRPTVAGLEPAEGPEAGGTEVAISGSGFVSGASVSFGGAPAESVEVLSASEIEAHAPAGSGTVEVTVADIGGMSAKSPADRYLYLHTTTTTTTTTTGGTSTGSGSLSFVSSAIPPPVLGVSGDVEPVSGTVLVRVPHSSLFVSLSSLREVPFGTVINATNGRVRVITTGPGGTTQIGEFFDGEFILTQTKKGVVVASLTGGSYKVCPTRRERSHLARASSAHASSKHVVRKLWANAHGTYSTKGNYASGAVLGTEWLTEDRCDGTLIKVTRDKVRVKNFVTHKTLVVYVGHQYLAKAP
jgi:hypothetical protein